MMVVILNVIIMALDGNLLSSEAKINLYYTIYFFNAIFILEFAIKMFGLGPLSI